MLEEVAKTLWRLLTIVIPGLFAYWAWRLILLFEPGQCFTAEALKQIDDSAIVTNCIIIAVALVQEAGAIVIEAVLGMRAKVMKTLHLISLAVLFVLIGCTTESEKESGRFIVKVDSINHSSTAAITDTITLRLYGTIGPDGCHSFSHFEDYRQPLRLDLTVWGQRGSGNNVCPDVMVYLDGKEYKFPATQQGWYSIYIHQPDGSVLKDSIIIQ
jgi:hypothetical protein